MSFTTQFLGTGVVFFLMFYVFGDGVVGSHDFQRARTMAFMQATLRELMVVWNCRSERKNAFRVGFTSNKWLLFAVVASAIVTMLVPFTGLFGTVPLTLEEWAIVAPLSLSGLLILPEIFYDRKIWRWR
jgi:Ca2+-transporting ATPase